MKNSGDNKCDTKVMKVIFILGGGIVFFSWLALFIAGLLVDSSYYRVAINYGFAEPIDWIYVILTFTISNVALIAFLAGLLGGIISKLRATEGFTISEKELKDDLTNSIMIENPFISAVRGTFVFIAILFMQYISSYTDLSSINKNNEQQVTNSELNYQELYLKLSERIDDSAVLKDIKGVLSNQEYLQKTKEFDTATVNQIFILKDKLKNLEKTHRKNPESTEPQALETKIKAMRRSLKAPANVDFSGVGITSFSYFKFAVIVSFLAFIFGYDTRRFAEFIGRIIPGSKS